MRAYLIATPAILVLAGCGLAERGRSVLWGEDHGTAAVVIADKVFTKSDLQRFFDSRLSDFRDPDKADRVKSNLLETFVEERLLLLRAERLRVEPNPQMVQSTMARIAIENPKPSGPPSAPGPDAELERSLAESLKIQQYLRDYLLRNVTVSEAECEEYYRQHLEDYVRNDVVHVREILVDDGARAERILSSLNQQKNKNFGELARVYSKAPSAADGGDLGTFQRGDLPENLEKVVFRLAPTMVSPIVQTRYGYHIFLLEEKILAHQQQFYEVKDEIQEKLLLQRERDLIARELDSLMKQTPVKIHLENLDFKYLGNRFSAEGAISP